MSDSYQSLLKLELEALLPRNSRPDISRYLFERYAIDSTKWLRKVFYLAKPIVPEGIQMAFRRGLARIQSRRHFPAWPIEPIVVQAVDAYLADAVENSSDMTVFRIGFWPDKASFALVLSHDIESGPGFDRALRLVETEKELGFTSSFNIVPERYPIQWGVIERLKENGCEIGVQGLKHDGKLFQSRKSFEEQSPKIRQYAREWGAAGFRSPSTLRNAEWMPEMKFDYDSSFPDTDPFEPQPGGCCSIWPFFIKDLVELPMTMPQDHTLFDILRHRDISIWRTKANWIVANSGMVLMDTHPDYLDADVRLDFYREFLQFMKSKHGMWHALPRDLARWWRDRDASALAEKDGRLVVVGPAAGRASIIKTTLENGILKDEWVDG